ncbi:MAG: ATPase, partial [Candidatus Lokiarchaeota archaeon]|nr:ATPase [Candidatus Lokiarchaeota archaeon]
LLEITDNFSGADIESFCREAAMVALRENINKRKVSKNHFKEALKSVHPTITDEIVKFYQEFEKILRRGSIRKKPEEQFFV